MQITVTQWWRSAANVTDPRYHSLRIQIHPTSINLTIDSRYHTFSTFYMISACCVILPRVALSDAAIRPSVCPSPSCAAALGYRHAGCLQLSHVRTVDPSTDGSRSTSSLTAPSAGGISSCRLRSDNLLNTQITVRAARDDDCYDKCSSLICSDNQLKLGQLTCQ